MEWNPIIRQSDAREVRSPQEVTLSLTDRPGMLAQFILSRAYIKFQKASLKRNGIIKQNICSTI